MGRIIQFPTGNQPTDHHHPPAHLAHHGRWAIVYAQTVSWRNILNPWDSGKQSTSTVSSTSLVEPWCITVLLISVLNKRSYTVRKKIRYCQRKFYEKRHILALLSSLHSSIGNNTCDMIVGSIMKKRRRIKLLLNEQANPIIPFARVNQIGSKSGHQSPTFWESYHRHMSYHHPVILIGISFDTH